MNWKQRILALVMVPVLVAVAGCATNALRVEAAKEVADKGKAVATGSRAYLSEVERARYAYNADLIAADPACRGTRVAFRRPPSVGSIVDPRSPPRGWLCTTLPRSAREDHAVTLTPITDDLRPTLLLIDSLASYSAAVSKILGAPGANPVQDIQNALATARAAQGLLHGLTGSAVTVVPAADDARLGAVLGFVQFLADLSNEADKVARLRRLEREGAGAAALIESLKNHLEAWRGARLGGYVAARSLSESLLRASVGPRSPLNAAQRRDFAQNYYDRVRGQDAAQEVDDAIRDAVNALGEAHTEYVQLLRDHPELNARQRARRAEIIRQRLTRGLELASTIIRAFAGA